MLNIYNANIVSCSQFTIIIFRFNKHSEQIGIKMEESGKRNAYRILY